MVFLPGPSIFSYSTAPLAMRTRESSTAPDPAGPGRPPPTRGGALGPGGPEGPSVATLSRPAASSITRIRGSSSVRSASSTRPCSSGRSRMRMRPSLTVTKGPGPKAGSSATWSWRSRTLGSGSAAIESPPNFTGRPRAWLACCCT